jgi:hypothetical protein
MSNNIIESTPNKFLNGLKKIAKINTRNTKLTNQCIEHLLERRMYIYEM